MCGIVRRIRRPPALGDHCFLAPHDHYALCGGCRAGRRRPDEVEDAVERRCHLGSGVLGGRWGSVMCLFLPLSESHAGPVTPSARLRASGGCAGKLLAPAIIHFHVCCATSNEVGGVKVSEICKDSLNPGSMRRICSFDLGSRHPLAVTLWRFPK
jgi:hypothetical protein